MKKMFSMLALVLSASFVAGCAVGAADVEEDRVVDEEVASAESELMTPAAQLACPGAGTCERAERYCDPENPSSSWCDILMRCYACWLTVD
ncbi:hypothetical protein WME75_43355 [Sorangium sp. So ce1014]|uniref:hypothetical protein n=1 Tax=Sorangium sp. So ce1014 TaxID=3133326 RepID=UPI003F5E3158